MKEIFKAIAKLLTLKNIVILIIVFAFVFFVSNGRIDISIFTSVATTVISNVLDADD